MHTRELFTLPPPPPFFNDSWASESVCVWGGGGHGCKDWKYLLADTKPTILMSALSNVSLKLHLETSNEIFQNKKEPSHARDVIP